ncbi:MAG: biotin--[acetyl-CoA-carboxylase] ligase [Candidatus Omnitrophica bacterium]|nr:biotin--[acetyl-CoA-carboxylase] ligase [Candidatus Omnitrophota bacterium]
MGAFQDSTVVIHRFKQIDSTNTVAFRYAAGGAPSGSVFVADYQTKGRGKWGRKWISPRGKNLLFSILLRPNFKASHAPWITQIACRSVAKVLGKRYDLTTSFKRPNDVLVNGKKICGVLVEAKGRTDGHIESLVIGIGLNVNTKGEEVFPGATSIYEEYGKRVSREALLKELLQQIAKDLKEGI